MLGRNYRAWITVLALLLYLIATNYYIYELTRTWLSIKQKHLLCDYSIGGIILFYLINKNSGNEISDEFNNVYLWAVVSNFILFIFTHAQILKQPIPMFLSFNGLIFAVTIMIAISAFRHGHFKN